MYSKRFLMKHIFLFLIVICPIVSCNRNEQLLNEIKQMQSAPIDLCTDSLLYYTYNLDNNSLILTSCSYSNDNISLVVYSDSNTCSSCAVKSMYRWFELLDTIDSKYGDELKVYFVFAPQKGEMHTLCQSIEASLFDYPIFIDTTNVFKRRNKHLPENPRMHTFMLDRKRNVILVGSPLDNESIRKLFFKIANDSILHG